ncbi:unnamed protein product [Adineta ricciae]|uniref:Uncharacterized protein n=1 Tax=Adineta ricciae TaxID=249248 RepID=A0A815LUP8_ADIRI|nr:unnamed protein product [Adineta ricciae]
MTKVTKTSSTSSTTLLQRPQRQLKLQPAPVHLLRAPRVHQRLALPALLQQLAQLQRQPPPVPLRKRPLPRSQCSFPILLATSTTVSKCAQSDFGFLLTQSGPTSWFQFSYTYLATSLAPTLRFIFDNGPADCSFLDGVSVTDYKNSSVELLSNPSFENSISSPVSWTVTNSSTCQGSSQGRIISSGCHSGSGSNCFMDNCTKGFEYLFQSFTANIGDYYNVSFWLEQTGGGAGCLYADIF